MDEKYQYNQFSNDEYDELIETKAKITAERSELKYLNKDDILLVRPSCGNMHKFVAEEDSCFFDICLPNYTEDSLRRITYFNEISDQLVCETDGNNCKTHTRLEYHTTPPVLPVGFDIKELEYRGEMRDDKIFM